MVLTPSQEIEFRHWMVKSLSGSFLALIILLFGWVTSDLSSGFYLMALGAVMFGGFPFWNIVWESKKVPMSIYYIMQITAVFSHQISSFFLKNHLEPLIPPFDILYCTSIWMMSDYAMHLILPKTHQRLMGFKSWREKMVKEIVKAHY